MMIRLVLFLLAFHCSVLAADAEIRQLRSLLDRGLYDAAEDFCNGKFQLPDLADTDKIQLATELVHSYTRRLPLLQSTPRFLMLRRIESLESAWLTPPNPTAPPDLVLAKITFRLQCALAYYTLGNYQRLEAEAASLTNQPAAYQQARAVLQDAMDRLKQCQQELQAFKQRVGINANATLQQQMQALEYSITLQQGIARKSRALTLMTHEERNVELQQVAEMLSALAAINTFEPVIVQCKIEKASCHRLCGELDRCAEILIPLRHADLTPECRLRTEAEWIRYNIAIGNIIETRQHYAADHPDAKLYPDFDLARLELFLANDPSRNIRSETAAAMRLEEAIGRQFGAYWAERARMLIYASGNRELNSAEMLAMHAERLEQEHRYIEAAELYEQAAARADANRRADAMYRYNRQSALVWQKALEQLPPDVPKAEYQQRLIALLRKLAEQNPNHPDALNLHTSAIDVQARLALSQPETLDDYLKLVKEHEGYWNTSPQLQRIRRLSVMLLERQGRHDEAAALLPLLDLAQLETLTPEIQRLRARQLDAEGNTQQAIDMLAALLKQCREPATLQLLAEILTRQPEQKSLEYALQFWTDLEASVPKNSEMWWTAREGIFNVFGKLNRLDEARESYQTLCILYPELGGAERKERLRTLFAQQ